MLPVVPIKFFMKHQSARRLKMEYLLITLGVGAAYAMYKFGLFSKAGDMFKSRGSDRRPPPPPLGP